jgi:hypothetical protein
MAGMGKRKGVGWDGMGVVCESPIVRMVREGVGMGSRSRKGDGNGDGDGEGD